MLVEQDPDSKFTQHVSEYLKKVHAVENTSTKAPHKDTKNLRIGRGDREVNIRIPVRYHEPSELDILFLDKKQNKSYVIYIVEVNDDTLKYIFNDLYLLTIAYLEGHYRVEKKGLLKKKRVYRV